MIDEELVYNYRLGNKEAMSFLFSLYETKVKPFYYKYENIFRSIGYDNEDMKMFVRECILRALDGFQFGSKKFNTYYSSIAYRSVISLYRDIEGTYEEKMSDNPINLSDSCIEERFYYQDQENKRNELNFILEKIHEIGEKEYQIITYYLEGNTYKEIADKMSMKVKAVTNYIQKIRTKLKKWESK
jgi:RNA polymerase sigma factor (sigma-70 family)